MVTVAASPERTVRWARSAGRADLPVHALAQLPDRIGLDFEDGEDLARVAELAEAYGVADRLSCGGTASAVEAGAPASSMAALVDSLSGGRGGPASKSRGDDSVLAGARVAVV